MKFQTKLAISLLLFLCLGIQVFSQNEFEGAVFTFGLYSGSESGDDDTAKAGRETYTFRKGEEIFIRPTIYNRSPEPLGWTITDVNWLFIFQLQKEGQSLPVGYREDKASLLSIREEEKGAGMTMAPDPILPWHSQPLGTMKLSDRFENLGPGKYNLQIQYKVSKMRSTKNGLQRVRLIYSKDFVIFD